ncbi:YesL family protein [Blautia producta]|uniref:DUF624 domain-containing protein n=1 Tax=Blautia producta TaxID=33035 RepID=A0A4V0Z859_9FIRM|nr:YesL family protein [Blautia producta]QBE99158.1 hypothetical protein PMF13cell1_04731 [Blautia producta]
MELIKYDSPLTAGVNKVIDIFWLSILWAVCCIPVITAGAATAALYYTSVKSVRRNREYVTKTFFHAFRQNLFSSIGVWILFLLLSVLIYCSFVFAAAIPNNDFRFFAVCIYLFIAFLILGTFCYVFPVLSRCSMKGSGLLRFSAGLMVKHFPTTLVLVMIVLLCFMGIWYFPLFLFCLPAVGSLLYSCFMEKVLIKYTPESSADVWYAEK